MTIYCKVVLLVSVVGFANCAICSVSPKSSLSRETQDLLYEAGGQPVEVQADITFTALKQHGMDKVTAHKWLDPLFERAGNAKHAYPLLDATHVPDSLTSAQAKASSLGLNTLSIQTRTIEGFIANDSPHALSLMERITIDPKPTECSDFVSESVLPYFETLIVLSDNPGARAFRGRLQALQASGIRRSSNASGLLGAGRLLLHISRSSLARDELDAEFVRAVERARSTDRELQAVDDTGELTKTISTLAAEIEDGGASPAPLVLAYRHFLISSLSRVQCGFGSIDREHVATNFNNLFKRFIVPSVPELTAKDLTGPPERKPIADQSLPYYQEFGRSLHLLFVAHEAELTHKTNGSQFKVSGEDITDFLRLLDRLEERSTSCKECLFVSLSQLHNILLDNLPQYVNSDLAIEKTVSWMADSDIQYSDPEQWIYRLRGLLNLGRNATNGDVARIMELTARGKSLVVLPHPGYQIIAGACIHSNSSMLRYYGRAEEILKPQYDIKR